MTAARSGKMLPRMEPNPAIPAVPWTHPAAYPLRAMLPLPPHRQSVSRVMRNVANDGKQQPGAPGHLRVNAPQASGAGYETY